MRQRQGDREEFDFGILMFGGGSFVLVHDHLPRDDDVRVELFVHVESHDHIAAKVVHFLVDGGAGGAEGLLGDGEGTAMLG